MNDFQRWGHDFDGTYPDPASLQAQSGVYVIWCQNGLNWTVLDVGESEDVRARLANHERASCWRRNCQGTIRYSATYTPGMSADGRRRIEAAIRQSANPPCGEV
jgi:hypothetical protein